jgi:hypothetical protein
LLLKFRPKKVEITHPSILLPNLPEAFIGYRIVQVSDFHLGTWLDSHDMLDVVELVNQQEPDLIAITGDFISFNPSNFSADLVRTLSRLESKDGVIAVLGNHDHYTDARLIREVLEQSRIIELRNGIHTIQRESSQLIFAGIDDYMTRHSDLEKVITQIPGPDNTVILLAHEPDFADISAASGRFAMQISGHTHGGQICLPYYGNLYLPRYGRKYPSGEYLVEQMVLYTNRGLGTSWLKFRFNCPPEITVFELNTNHQNHLNKPDNKKIDC